MYLPNNMKLIITQQAVVGQDAASYRVFYRHDNIIRFSLFQHFAGFLERFALQYLDIFLTEIFVSRFFMKGGLYALYCYFCFHSYRQLTFNSGTKKSPERYPGLFCLCFTNIQFPALTF